MSNPPQDRHFIFYQMLLHTHTKLSHDAFTPSHTESWSEGKHIFIETKRWTLRKITESALPSHSSELCQWSSERTPVPSTCQSKQTETCQHRPTHTCYDFAEMILRCSSPLHALFDHSKVSVSDHFTHLVLLVDDGGRNGPITVHCEETEDLYVTNQISF